MRYNKPQTGEPATIFNVSGKYDFSPALFVRGEIGTNFRLPDAEELYADDPDDERGNPNLKPERSRSANLSLGGQIDAAGHPVNWEVIGFARNISNLIDYATFDSTTNQEVFGNVPGTVTVARRRSRGQRSVQYGVVGQPQLYVQPFQRNRQRPAVAARALESFQSRDRFPSG